MVVCGCLAERQREELLEARPEIDSLLGVFSRDEVARVADRLVGGLKEQQQLFSPAPIRALADTERLRITPRHFSYLKISEGCDRLCTFCAIPQMRGKHASKPLELVLDEARQLAGDGVRELIVVAQDTTYYGIDSDGRPRLAELLAELDQVEGLDWIRLMYFYPMYIDDELIQTIAGSDRILPYIDIPLQHASDNMLKRMSRRVTRSETEDLLTRLREGIPELALRTTMITGFPGETEADVEELLQFVHDQKFHHLGAFTYSYEASTPSSQLPDHLPEEVKHARRNAVMAAQQEVAFQRARDRIGSQLDVIIDRSLDTDANAWIGRSKADAPDVDAAVFVSGGSYELHSGAIIRCEVVDTSEYDLAACAIDTPS